MKHLRGFFPRKKPRRRFEGRRWAGLPPRHAFRRRERGIALLIVVSVLTVVGIMGVAFSFSMYLETQATRQFVSTVQSRFVSEAGVAHARALLDEDRLASRIDEPGEAWSAALAGDEVDVTGDGTLDAHWLPVDDVGGQTVGRYGLKVMDEASKVNLQIAQADPSPYGIGAVNLTTLLSLAGVQDAVGAAQAIETYRHGPDDRPGVALVDDDGDGAVDEPDEYQPVALLGDDRRLEGLEDLRGIAGLSGEEIRTLADLATVYSWEPNTNLEGAIRLNVNTSTADELVRVMLEAGVEDPWQAAANTADYVDEDLVFSVVTKSSQVLAISDLGPLGGWTWSEESGGHYVSEQAGGGMLVWSVSAPSGTFRLRVLGVRGSIVGDVTLEGRTIPSVESGQDLGSFPVNGGLTIRVDHPSGSGAPCRFRGIELVADTGQGISTVMVRGIEAVRFNELMIEPSAERSVSSASFNSQGSDWSCPGGASACTNSGVGQARWVWTDPLLVPGWYYLRVLAPQAGQTVGHVKVGNSTELLLAGQRHPEPIQIGADGKIQLTVAKESGDGTYYLAGIELSLQPDSEYVELINLSDEAIDLSGWLIEGEATAGRQARLPEGAQLAPHGLLVAAVDLDDEQGDLAGNEIDARTAWEIPDDVQAVQLEFPTGVPSPDDDWLHVTTASGSPTRLVLRNAVGVVDEVEYRVPLPTTSDFQSLEKGDPSVVTDEDQDGLDDGWYPSLQLYTPGLANDNEEITEEREGLEPLVHDPAEEVAMLNRPLSSVGELAGLPSGDAWEPFASAELAKIVDRLTVEGWRLEAEGNQVTGQDVWMETAHAYVYNQPDEIPGPPSGWRWVVPDGTYRLSLYGWSGESMSVRWELADGSFTEWSPPISTDVQGRLVIGQITIGLGETPSSRLMLEARCESASGICHVDHVRLDPQLIRIGPVNVNTAPAEVLLALPGMTDAIATRLIAGRPYGERDGKFRGIGDLLEGSVLGSTEEDKLAVFRELAHLVTIRSDVFRILSVGQALDGDLVRAAQRIEAIVQR